MDEIMNYSSIDTVEELTNVINNELHKAAISFVRVGYLLKRARDEDILKDSGYPDIYVYANTKFGLDKSQVSRFMRINDRYSIGGYSEHLKEEYEGFGYSKLALMLTLPDEINEELSPEYSKSEINAIKAEYEAEQKISDMEVMMEEKRDEPDEFVAMIVKEMNDEHPGVARYFFDTMRMAEKLGVEPNEADIKDAYIPEGTATYDIRIPGQGTFMITMKDDEITILNMRSLEKSPLGWVEFKDVLMEDMKVREFKDDVEKKKPKKVNTAKKENPYVKEVREYHEREDVAPVQQCTDDVPQEDKDDTESVQDPTEDTQSEENNTQAETENEHVERVEGEIVKDEEPTELEKQVCEKLHKIIDEVEAPEITNWGHIKDRLQDVIRDINLNF